MQAVREGAKRPVTVKMRAGVESGKPNAVECALAAQKGGASAVCVHPRYREQFYSGVADHTITKAVKEALDIPVIANGDIVDLQSLERVRDITGADGFMIARGALGRPWIFAELQGKDASHDTGRDIYEHISVCKIYERFYGCKRDEASTLLLCKRRPRRKSGACRNRQSKGNR